MEGDKSIQSRMSRRVRQGTANATRFFQAKQREELHGLLPGFGLTRVRARAGMPPRTIGRSALV